MATGSSHIQAAQNNGQCHLLTTRANREGGCLAVRSTPYCSRVSTPRLKPHARTDAARLRRLRAVLGMTQREMAAEFQVAHGAIATWERGRQRPPGPVRRLLELYEAELCITDSTTGLSRLKISATSWLC